MGSSPERHAPRSRRVYRDKSHRLSLFPRRVRFVIVWFLLHGRDKTDAQIGDGGPVPVPKLSHQMRSTLELTGSELIMSRVWLESRGSR